MPLELNEVQKEQLDNMIKDKNNSPKEIMEFFMKNYRIEIKPWRIFKLREKPDLNAKPKRPYNKRGAQENIKSTGAPQGPADQNTLLAANVLELIKETRQAYKNILLDIRNEILAMKKELE